MYVSNIIESDGKGFHNAVVVDSIIKETFRKAIYLTQQFYSYVIPLVSMH